MTSVRPRSVRLLALALPVFVVPLAAQATAPAARTIDPAAVVTALAPAIDRALESYAVPGVALGVVHRDGTTVTRGFGRRDVGSSDPVDADTLFAIGSASKAFTATLLGMQVEAGLLEWDKPVRTWLPRLAMHDPYVSEHLTPRDLLCHRSGLPRHDASWYLFALKRSELLDRLPHFEPSAGFRARWQYQNLMFVLAGVLAEERGGKTWEEMIRKRLFAPLGMTRSNTSVTVSAADANHARPHAETDGVLEVIAFRNIDEVGPAGSINSSVADMVHWLRLQLRGGVVGDQRLISEATLREIHKPEMVVPGAGDKHEPHTSYALGWFVAPWRGAVRLHHGGGIDGFRALVTFLPDDGWGVVVLTNRTGSPLSTDLTRQVMDGLLEVREDERVDWLAKGAARLAKAKQTAAKGKAAKESENTEAAAAEASGPRPPTHDLGAYVREFRHPGYGSMHVERRDDGLWVVCPANAYRLEHKTRDSFLVKAKGAPPFPAFFTMDGDGRIAELRVQMEASLPPAVFVAKRVE